MDDDEDTVESMAALLALDGHEVVTATDGATSINKAITWRPHLILMDIAMRSMDGYELASHLQTLPLSPKPYLVAVTGYGAQADKQRCAKAGFDLHLVKPVSPPMFYGLTELLMQLKGAMAVACERAVDARKQATTLILLYLEMSGIHLDIAEATKSHELRAPHIAKAYTAHDRVRTWLGFDACDDRRPQVVQALDELRARLIP